MAYPAVFVLDETGRVVDKRIKENYRAREGVLTLLEATLGIRLAPTGPRETVRSTHVTVTAVTDSAEYVRWQETRLHVMFEVESGWHVYSHPVPAGFTPVTVEVTASPEVAVNTAEYPPTRAFRVEGLDEKFYVNEGHFEVRVPIAVNVPAGSGTIELNVAVHIQACNEAECLPPAVVTLVLRPERGCRRLKLCPNSG